MNVRQLRKLVLETINEERRPKRKQRRAKNRKKVMTETLRKARLVLEAPTTSAEFYNTKLKGSAANAQDKGNVFKAMGIQDTNANQQVWQQLYADSPSDATVTGPTFIPCKNLLPTQSEIGSANSLGNIFFGNDYSDDGFGISSEAQAKIQAGQAKFNNDILAAKGAGDKFYIIDGHHRWSQAFMLGPDVAINCLVLNMPGKSADDILQAVHVAISELETSKDPVAHSLGKKFNGENLLSKNAEFVIKKYAASLASGTIAGGLNLGGSLGEPMKQWAQQAGQAEITIPEGIDPNTGLPPVEDEGGQVSETKWRSGGLLLEAEGGPAQQLAASGGSSLPLAIGGPNCTMQQYCDHFINAIKAMRDIYKRGDTKDDAPPRIMMPQADDMGIGGLNAYKHIEDGKITTENKQVARWNKLAGLLKD